jgi:hypothetical protein
MDQILKVVVESITLIVGEAASRPTQCLDQAASAAALARIDATLV